MKKANLKRAIALTCATCLTLTGCNKFVGEDATSYPLESTLTKQEVVDYYAKALEYDAIVSKNIDVHETTYVKKDIEGEKAEKLKLLTSMAETILGQDTYEITEENLKVVSPDTFEYIKGVIDNEVLSNGKIKNIQGALGYYFVDVEYDVSPKMSGTFNQLTSLVGLDGAFYTNYDGTYSVDNEYLITVVDKLNEYFYNNRIISCASYDLGTGIFKIEEGVQPAYSPIKNKVSNLPENSGELVADDFTSDENYNDDADNTEEILNAPEDETEDAEVSDIKTEGEQTEQTEQAEQVDENTEDTEQTDTDSEEQESQASATDPLQVKQTYATIVAADRKIQFDASLVNSVAGSSLKQTATMPDLTTVYNLPAKEGTMSGYGIYEAGGSGLKVFGFKRENMNGKMTLRYVYKDDSNGTGEILGTNVYPVEESIKTGITVSGNKVLIPEFLELEFSKLIERADRVQVDCDLSGIMSGHIYEDMGVGILRGYRSKKTNITKYMSTIRQVINRDTTNNSYIIEIETTTIEGAKDVDCYGTYKDRSYVVIQQQGNEFKIIDQIRISRDLVSEPSINPDSTTQKRLVALNLAGTIPDESKEDITKLMSDLYTASTNRLLYGPYDIKVKGETVTIEKGMYDCFQNDPEILSTDKLEYMQSQLRNVLTRNGIDVQSVYSGTITEWIGGYENQAEFTTEELVTYEGKSEAYYMQVYYLVSKLNDVWVIDERTILDETEIKEQAEIDSIKERVGQ